MISGFTAGPDAILFKFFVYQVFRIRGDDFYRIRVFTVNHSGHDYARSVLRSHPETYHSLIAENKVDVFFTCSKRAECVKNERTNSGDLYLRPEITAYIGEQVITREQASYFLDHRKMGNIGV